VIHNTETPQSETLQETVDSISKSHHRRFPTQKLSCVGTYISYHYLIAKDWLVVQTRCIDEIGFHDGKTNETSIGVALVGNFNTPLETPTKEQYEALRQLLTILKWQFTGAIVQPHWSWGSSCPWKLFDKNEIIDFIKNIPTNKNPLLWVYNITRYYSPEQWQDHYFMNKTYEADVTTNCGKDAIGNDNCLYPARWWKFTKEDEGRVVACWQQFPAFTKFEIKGYWWVTCRDRGSAIVWKRLDLRVGKGMSWLNVIENTKRPAWDVEIINIKFPPK